jgi:hypothetical protein
MPAGTKLGIDEMPELQFLARLRDSTERYLESLDAWEAQYQKYYRVASPGPGAVSADLESLHQNHLNARKRLQECVPRARRMCLKYQTRDPWQATLHIALGAHTPQVGATTAIGKAERTLLAKCMLALEVASSTPAAPLKATPEERRRGFLQRVLDYFF